MQSYLKGIKKHFSSSQTVEVGSKILMLDNLGWLLVPFAVIAYSGMTLFIPETINLVTIGALAAVIIFLATDVIGFTILGLGLLFYDEKSTLARKAGISLLIWSALTVLWRILFGIALTPDFQASLSRDEKYEVLFPFLEWTYFAGCLAILVGFIYLTRCFNSLVFLVYAVFNTISAYFVAPAFIIITEETLVYYETLILICVVFKLFLIPTLGILSFRSVLEQLNAEKTSKLVDGQEMRTSTFDVELKKAQITRWEGFKAVVTKEKERVVALIIECPNCKEKYPKETIHTNCLYCGAKLPVPSLNK